MTEQTQSLTKLNDEIKRELADDYTCKVLLATTFKKLSFDQMRQAILEWMIRWFTFKNFLQKDIYAVPYGGWYSLITSIDFARKVWQDGWIVWTDIPVFTKTKWEDWIERIESCTMTVKKRFADWYVWDFSAIVYFFEYYKAWKTYNWEYTPSLWDTKPHTMIAKVAEMHALRKACPEKLDKQYIEEEMIDTSRLNSEDLKVGVDEVLWNMSSEEETIEAKVEENWTAEIAEEIFE